MAITPGGHAMARPATFFAALRRLTGPLDQEQVDIVNDILAASICWPTGWLAYALATAWHEARFIPQREWGRGRGRPYARPGKYGQPQYGRGLVQLTWDRNYEWADKALHLGGSLLANFDRALEPEIAVRILIEGMKQGAFTGRKLADYIDGSGNRSAFVKARRIINGTDRAEDIATYADVIRSALIAAGRA
ncbi:MAG: hypothetical protein P8X77_16760 [Maritimibacter sp.]